MTTPLVTQQALDDLQKQVAEQRQVIASLQAANFTLQASLTGERLITIPRSHLERTVRPDARENAKLLREERARCQVLEDDLARATESRATAKRHLEEFSREKSRLEELRSAAQTRIGNLEAGRLELDNKLNEASRKVDSLQRGTSHFVVETQGRPDTKTDIERLTLDLGSAQQQVHDSRVHSTKVEMELFVARSQIEELRANVIANSKRWQEQDQSRQQTISLLVSEKASLIASVQRLEEVEIGTFPFNIMPTLLRFSPLEHQGKEKLFLAEQTKTVYLTKRVQELEITAAKQGNELEETHSREKELLDRVRDQVGALLDFSGRVLCASRNAKSNSGKLNWRKHKLLPVSISNGFGSWKNRLRVMTERTN